ncbi:hypothetical protein SDC9_205191 [bioreactor metagenome]|uniref:Uncharacterized protein n=1 Tax=bioreactor metagenome TaxID=1076179 RepID=A0A645J264_9ZZZZ
MLSERGQKVLVPPLKVHLLCCSAKIGVHQPFNGRNDHRAVSAFKDCRNVLFIFKKVAAYRRGNRVGHTGGRFTFCPIVELGKK